MRAGPNRLARIAALIPGVSTPAQDMFLALRAMIAGDMRLPADMADDLHPCLMLAATHPEADELSFEAATALLLADRIAKGSGQDDLFWHWDAFALHYRAADAPIRAALMQGFALSMEMGALDCDLGPTLDDLTTYDAAQIIGHLRQTDPRVQTSGASPLFLDLPGPEKGRSPRMARHPQDAGGLAQTCLEALTRPTARDVLEQIWADNAAGIASRPAQEIAPVWAAFRWMYETRPNWDPARGAGRMQTALCPIPWVTLPG